MKKKILVALLVTAAMAGAFVVGRGTVVSANAATSDPVAQIEEKDVQDEVVEPVEETTEEPEEEVANEVQEAPAAKPEQKPATTRRTTTTATRNSNNNSNNVQKKATQTATTQKTETKREASEIKVVEIESQVKESEPVNPSNEALSEEEICRIMGNC